MHSKLSHYNELTTVHNIENNVYLQQMYFVYCTICNYRLKFKDEMNKRAELEEAMQHYVSYEFGVSWCVCVCVCVLEYGTTCTFPSPPSPECTKLFL